MRRSIKTAVLWFMLIALPVQGVASATMLLCGPNHHGNGTTAASADHDDHHAGVTHDADHGTSGDMQASNTDTDHHDGRAKCAACSPCSGTMTLVTTTFTLPDAPRHGRQPIAVDSVSAPHFSSDGPDRPPRAVLA